MGVNGTFVPDDLYNGVFPIVTEPRLVPAGTAAFKRGAVLTDTSIPVVAGTAENADCIALENYDSSTQATRIVVAIAGSFNTAALSCGDATAPSSLKAALRAKSIYIAKAVQ